MRLRPLFARKAGRSRPAPGRTKRAKPAFRPVLTELEDRALFAVDLAVGLNGNEPTIAVDPSNNNIVAAAVFRTVLISTDGGQTFPTTVNVAAPNGYTGAGGDPSLTFDSQGNLYFGYLASNPAPANPNFKIGVFSARINTATGAIAQNTTVAVETPNTNDHDKEWIAADHWAGSPFRDNIYLIWTRLGGGSAIMFSRSTDNGVNWSAPVQLNGAGQGFVWPSEVNVAPNGDVWVAWHTHTDETAGNTGEVRMRRSVDGGANFQAELANLPFPAGTADLNDNSGGTANGGSGNPRVPGLLSWLQGSVQPRILTDPVRPNTIYVVANDDPDNNYGTGDAGDIVFARSTDNGANWTRQTISHAPANTTQFMPSAAIDELGNIAVTWYDTRNGVTNAGLDGVAGNADDDFLLDVYGTVSTDGGLTFCTTDFQINDTAFDPDNSPGNRPTDRFPGNNAFRIGEYNGLAAANGIAYADWTGNSFSGTPSLPTGQQTLFDTFAIVTRVTAPANQNAVEGNSKAITLGSFGDVCGGPWSVDVDWGDGTPHTTFTAATAGTLGTQSHTYAEEGNYTVKVTVTDTGAGETDSDSKTFQVAVSDPAVIPTAVPVSAVEGADTGAVAVATFTDPGGAEVLADYSAMIDWGDGTPATVGTITFSGTLGSKTDAFTVLGNHTYAEESAPDHPGSNPYDITVTIHHDVAPDAVVHSSAVVSDPAVITTGGFNFVAVEGDPSATQTVATFTDPGGAEDLDDYAALIDWGDTTAPSAGTITESGGVFTVQGSHTYAVGLGTPSDFGNTFCDADPPSYHKKITVTVSHEAAPTAEAVSDAKISLKPGSAHLASDGSLIVVGTPSDDTIVLNNVGTTHDTVTVQLGSAVLGTFTVGPGRIVVAAMGGADMIQVAAGVRVEAVLYGGPGNDRIKGGGARNILIGCEGDDTLSAGNLGDLMVGGAGADRIVGGNNNDILVAGLLEDALNTEDDRYDDLVAILYAGTIPAPFHAADDGAVDKLTGSAGFDGFYGNFSGTGVLDVITDNTDDMFDL